MSKHSNDTVTEVAEEKTEKSEKIEKGEKGEKPEKGEKSEKIDKTDVRFENSMPIEEAISYFEAIVNGLKKGTITLKQDDRKITMCPPAHLDVEVRASRKKDKERIQFEIAWRAAQGSDLTISSE